MTDDDDADITVNVTVSDINPEAIDGCEDLGRAVALLHEHTNLRVNRAALEDDDGPDTFVIEGYHART